MGAKNIRPKALKLLIADGLVIKTNNGKYYLDKEKLAQAKAQLGSKNKNEQCFVFVSTEKHSGAALPITLERLVSFYKRSSQ